MEIRYLRFIGKVAFLLLSTLVVQARGATESNYCWGQVVHTSQKNDTSIQNNIASTDKAKVEFLIDQANEVLHQQYSYNIGFLKPIGQEFFPTLHALDAVELIIDDANCSEAGGTGGSLKVLIHEGDINGTVIGTSKTASFSNCFYDIMRFEFPTYIPLTPGKKYVIEPVYVSGNTSTVYVDKGPAPLYKAGSFIFQGALEPEMDMWFREGLSKSIAKKPFQAKKSGWKKLVRADGTPFKSERECLSYIKMAKKQ